MNAVRRMTPLRYRTVFISDVPLGFRGRQAELQLEPAQRIALASDV